MISTRIEGTTHELGPPPTWDKEKNGACTKLAVRVVKMPVGLVFQSSWEPTPDEIELLKAGGRVILSVYGGQPPVHLEVMPAAIG